MFDVNIILLQLSSWRDFLLGQKMHKMHVRVEGHKVVLAPSRVPCAIWLLS